MEGAAEPGQTPSKPLDKQGITLKEIHEEVHKTRGAIEETVLRLTERGQHLDNLQEQTGESSEHER